MTTITEPQKRWALGVLLIVYTANFMDRTLVAIVGEALKVDLDMTNAQLGLLGGLAFAAFYTVLGIPIARLAERYNRVTIISVSLLVWSGMTALCGMAASYVQLFLLRMGVGVGEAGCSPAAHSLICDYYEPRRRASALAIYSCGGALGQMLAAFGGGWIVQHYGWRMAFLVAGIPGIALALLVRVSLREPPRGGADVRQATVVPDRFTLRGEVDGLMRLARRLFGYRSFAHIATGCVLASFAGYGIHQFMAPYFIREFGLSYTQAGAVFGVSIGLASGIGMLLGGFLTDWAARRDLRWYTRVPAIGVFLAAPTYVLGFAIDSWVLAAVVLALPAIFHFTYLAPTLGVMHNLVAPNERASATALLLLLISLFGLGFGPWFTGIAIDVLAGGAAAGEFDEAAATRGGLVVSALVYVWAAVHYALAARTVREDLADGA